jgi:anaerobic selenocysteine-containing dehydrogenase
MSGEIHRSVCPFDCPDCCGLMVEINHGRVVRVSGDPEHPFTRGFLCAKMNHYQRTIHSPQRLTQPLLRCGPKGAGEFRPISWDDALERISAKWREIIAAHGAEAILPYSYAGTMGIVQRNAGHAFFHRLGASLLERGICTPAKGCGWSAVMGSTPAPDPDEVQHSDLIILWSSNAAATHIHFLQRVKEAKKNGAKVWLIDLYSHQTAAQVDQVFLVKPGSDAALALGLMHLLVRDGLCDEKFIAEKVQGFSELKARVLPDYPPATVSRITGIGVAQLEQMAHEYATARAPFISIGGGVSRYTNGAMSVRAILALPALVGAWTRRGGGCTAGISSGAAFAMERIERPDLLKGSPRTINMSQLGMALTQKQDPPVKSLFVYSSNPAAVAPDQNQVLRGLAREDLFTVVHERFMTDSARYADIVLPATSSVETSDIYRSYGHYGVQRCRPLIAPPGEAKSNLQVFSLLAKSMGFTDDFFDQNADQLIDQLIDRRNPWWTEVDFTALAAGRVVKLSPPNNQQFQTPSGRIEIFNPTLAEVLPRYLPLHDSGFPLQLVTAPAMKTLNSTFFEREELHDSMCVCLNPAEVDQRGLQDGQKVLVWNQLGEVEFFLRADAAIPPGLAVAPGVWWQKYAPGKSTVNALTAQKLTDQGGGSTFYDNRVDVKPEQLN